MRLASRSPVWTRRTARAASSPPVSPEPRASGPPAPLGSGPRRAETEVSKLDPHSLPLRVGPSLDSRRLPSRPPQPAVAAGSPHLRTRCFAQVKSSVSAPGRRSSHGRPWLWHLLGPTEPVQQVLDPTLCTYPTVQATEQRRGPCKAPLSLHLNGVGNFIQEEIHIMSHQ